jgi:hypothetical protein
MIDRAQRERMTHGETGMTGTNDDNVSDAGLPPLYAI